MSRKPEYLPQSAHGDRRLAEIARRQRGYVARKQLIALGENGDAIDYRLKVGRLIPVHRGIYAVGHLSQDPLDRAYGAVLACGPQAVLSHASAATLWGIYRHWTMPFHVTAPTGHRQRGIVAHRSKLHPDDRTYQLGIPVTSPAQTLLDNAPDMTEKALTRGINNLRPNYLSLGEIQDVIERHPRAPGAKCLRPFVKNPTGPTRSDFEDLFKAFCKRYDLPEPLINTTLHGFEIDAYFPVERVIVELDSWGFHSSRHSFRSDRDRDATMLAHDIPTVRVTWERLTDRPAREAQRLIQILARRRSRPA